MSTKTKPKKEKKKKTREDLTPEYTLGDITLPKPVKTDEYQEKIESIQSDIDTKGPTLNEMAVNMLTEDQKELIKSYGLTTGAPSWEWGNRYEGGKFILPTGESIALTNPSLPRSLKILMYWMMKKILF